MNTMHLTDQQIQRVVLEQGHDVDHWLTHMATCKDCQLKADLYRSLLDKVSQQEKPVFNFDLASQVMAQLEPTKPSIDFSHIMVGFILIVIVSWLGSIFYWTGHEWAMLFTRLSSIATGLILLTISGFIIFLVIGLYQEFDYKMKKLTLT